MFVLDISKGSRSPKKSRLGGGFSGELDSWPLSDKGMKMTPLLTIRQDIFPTLIIPAGFCVTVFLPYGGKSCSVTSLRSCALNDQSQVKNFKGGAAKVILHRDLEQDAFLDYVSHLPELCVKTREMGDDEKKEDLQDEINGAYISKVLGRPSWVQDEIFMPEKYFFAAQLTEFDLVKCEAEYEGVFSDGSGYVYLRHALHKLSHGDVVGEFFLQYT